MATTPTSVRASRLGKLSRSRKGSSTGIGLVIVVLLLIAAAYVISTWVVPVDRSDPRSMTQEQLVRDLINRGLIPAQVLEPAPLSREDIVRDLINRGLIPAQVLED